MRTLLRALVVTIFFGQPVWAAVSSCQNVGDGTPCANACVVSGICDHGSCRATTYATNGTSCASGVMCSTGDSCKDGVCMPGGTFNSCPDQDACNIGVCVAGAGCGFQNICLPPDLLPPPPTDILPPPPVDMAQPVLPQVDMAQPQVDMAQPIMPNADMSQPDMANADMQPDMALTSQIRGSDVFGCNVVGESMPNWSWAFALLLLTWRSRRQRG